MRFNEFLIQIIVKRCILALLEIGGAGFNTGVNVVHYL